MNKFDFTAVFYSKRNYDMEYKLHNICKKFSVNMVTVIDFVELTIKSIQLMPEIVFVDCDTVALNSKNIDTFIEKHEFRDTTIVFVVDKKKINYAEMIEKCNIRVANINELEDIIDNIQNNFCCREKNLICDKEIISKLDMSIYKLLYSLGFSAKHSGCAFIRSCIQIIVEHNGVFRTLAGDVYPIIASKYKTSIQNIERNIRNAITCGWNMYGKENWYKTFYSKFMKQGKKPTNRELIFMCCEIILSHIKYGIAPNYEAL